MRYTELNLGLYYTLLFKTCVVWACGSAMAGLKFSNSGRHGFSSRCHLVWLTYLITSSYLTPFLTAQKQRWRMGNRLQQLRRQHRHYWRRFIWHIDDNSKRGPDISWQHHMPEVNIENKHKRTILIWCLHRYDGSITQGPCTNDYISRGRT